MTGEVALILAAALAALSAATVVWAVMRNRLARERARVADLEHTERERERLGRMLENLADGFVAFSPQGEVSYANRQAGRMLNDAATVLFLADAGAGPLHRQLRISIHHHEHGESGAGRLLIDRWVEAHAYPSEEGLSVYLHDNTERKRREEHIRQQSLMDDLTGLYNRRGFLTLADQHLKLAERTGRNVLLLFADLDDFKEINDRFGHHEGDRALTEAARAIRSAFRDSDIIARIGGDEFAILALETSDVSGDLLARRMREALSDRNTRSGRGYDISLSLGIARYDSRTPATIADLLARADALMYEHKREKDAARVRGPGAFGIVTPPDPPSMRGVSTHAHHPTAEP
jgi:diguanylate cyclase (GGDEF)-like protein